ncbi:MAG: lipoyl(octanoyl) transferase LipB [Spirochaetia bacterium]|nr:lipoyl(octanoyl) transferase LipB [Spirochaetia bacterium]MCF7942058.1 lipoyl(octanoyl) transferase LipB [Spirochaetia bacterium]
MRTDEIISRAREAKDRQITCIDCGTIAYEQALSLQRALQQLRLEQEISDVVLIMEHPPVITLGIRKEHNVLRARTEELTERGISIVPIQRGGGATAHNPGQLIIYPIIALQERKLHVAPYVHFLEDMGIALLQQFGITAYSRKRYPGIWVGEKKIASVGVQITRGVSMHGIALNAWNDLSIFSHIVPCGIDGVIMTSIAQECGAPEDMPQLVAFSADYCIDYFSTQGRPTDERD